MIWSLRQSGRLENDRHDSSTAGSEIECLTTSLK